jgi:formate hydrogenlyase subunit 3/multisubunit Na+/H+ antiporter MnhD subunit
MLAALDWSQGALGPEAAGEVEKLLIIGLGLVSLILGGLAAMFHDDIEHVLGYSILQDAGIAVLAFAALEPTTEAAAKDWLVASATIKTALAAWAAVVRATYGGHRLADLGGWARRSPALGVSFAAILIAAIGLPGMALFDARSVLITGSLPGVGTVLVILVALMPAIYLGRIGLAGLGPITTAVAGGPSGRPRWTGGRAAGWSAGPLLELVRAVPAELRANRAPLMALGVVILAAMAVVTAMGGAGGAANLGR